MTMTMLNVFLLLFYLTCDVLQLCSVSLVLELSIYAGIDIKLKEKEEEDWYIKKKNTSNNMAVTNKCYEEDV